MAEPQIPSPASAFPSPAALPPGTVQQLHLGKSLCDHGSKNQPEEDAAYQHVVIVIFQDIKLLRWVHSGLVDVQAICNNLKRRDHKLVIQLPAENQIHQQRLTEVYSSD